MIPLAIPKECAAQVVRVLALHEFEQIRICLSGSFRLEQVLGQVCTAKLIGNDVGLIPCAIGTLVASGAPLPFRFVEKLAFAQAAVAGASPVRKVASLLVASEMGRFTGPSEHAAIHLRHYQENFATYLDRAEDTLKKLMDSFRLDGFWCGDFRQHAGRAKDAGAAIIAFPPSQKGNPGKFLDANVSWERPVYDPWDPGDLEGWAAELDHAGVAYCIGAERLLESIKPVAAHYSASRKPLYIYAKGRTSSLVRKANAARPFRYEPVEPSALTKDTHVDLVPVGSQEIAFLKDRYLAKGIAHTAGHLNFLVYLDRKLAGGFIYTRDKHEPIQSLYILSDFSVTRERRVSKLISMLASSRLPVSIADKRFLIRVEKLVTTAFTDRPVSMKYRGIFELTKRGHGYLEYESKVRQASPEEVYREWFTKHAARNQSDKGQAP